MGDPKVPPIGPRIRAERARREVTIRALARDIGVSPSLISQIETGKSQPSVSTLYAMTTALGLSLEDLFAPAAAEVPAPAEAVAAGDYAWPASLPAHRLGPHVRPEDRTCLTLDTGVTWERLGQLQPHTTDFLLVTYPPGASSSSSAGLMRHSGSEYGYVLAGELTLTLGFEEIRLAPGDAVSFESATPHRYRNDGPEPATGVWFVAG